jgi:hypothetical protein
VLDQQWGAPAPDWRTSPSSGHRTRELVAPQLWRVRRSRSPEDAWDGLQASHRGSGRFARESARGLKRKGLRTLPRVAMRRLLPSGSTRRPRPSARRSRGPRRGAPTARARGDALHIHEVIRCINSVNYSKLKDWATTGQWIARQRRGADSSDIFPRRLSALSELGDGREATDRGLPSRSCQRSIAST